MRKESNTELLLLEDQFFISVLLISVPQLIGCTTPVLHNSFKYLIKLLICQKKVVLLKESKVFLTPVLMSSGDTLIEVYLKMIKLLSLS